MKARTKGIIAGCIAACVLGAAVIILLKTAPETEEDEELASASDSSVPESRLLYEKNSADITSIELKKKDSSIVIENSDAGWTIPAMNGLPLSMSSIASAVEECSSVTAKQTVVENAEDISIYGLDSPQVTAKIHFSGSDKTLAIGNEIPSGGQYYFTLDGTDTVYTIASSDVNFLLYDSNDFINKIMYGMPTDTDPSDNYDPAKINSISVTRPDIPYEIKVEYDPLQDDPDVVTGNTSTHIMTEPVSLFLNPDRSKDFLEKIFSLTASGVAAVNPTEEELVECGMKSPGTSVYFDINAGKFVLDIGGKILDEEGAHIGYYGMARGIKNVIYTFDKDDLPWVTAMPLDISVNHIVSDYIYSVDSVDVEANGVTRHFELNGDKDNFSVKLDGEDFPDVSSFKTFYQFILRGPAEELFTEDFDAEPSVTVRINSKVLGDDIIEFIPHKDRMTAVRLNGRMSFRCRTVYADRLAANLESLISGGEIIENW